MQLGSYRKLRISRYISHVHPQCVAVTRSGWAEYVGARSCAVSRSRSVAQSRRRSPRRSSPRSFRLSSHRPSRPSSHLSPRCPSRRASRRSLRRSLRRPSCQSSRRPSCRSSRRSPRRSSRRSSCWSSRRPPCRSSCRSPRRSSRRPSCRSSRRRSCRSSHQASRPAPRRSSCRSSRRLSRRSFLQSDSGYRPRRLTGIRRLAGYGLRRLAALKPFRAHLRGIPPLRCFVMKRRLPLSPPLLLLGPACVSLCPLCDPLRLLSCVLFGPPLLPLRPLYISRRPLCVSLRVSLRPLCVSLRPLLGVCSACLAINSLMRAAISSCCDCSPVTADVTACWSVISARFARPCHDHQQIPLLTPFVARRDGWALGTRAGRRARVGARSDHWICRCRASLARQRDYRPRSC